MIMHARTRRRRKKSRCSRKRKQLLIIFQSCFKSEMDQNMEAERAKINSVAADGCIMKDPLRESRKPKCCWERRVKKCKLSTQLTNLMAAVLELMSSWRSSQVRWSPITFRATNYITWRRLNYNLQIGPETNTNHGRAIIIHNSF